MKKYIAVFATLALAPSLAAAQSAAGLSLAPERGAFGEGENFSVRVLLAAPEPITSFHSSVLYDASRLSLVRVEEERGQFPYWWENGFRSGGAAGEVKLQASAPAPGVRGDSLPVATLHFRAAKSGLAALLVNQNSLVLTSSDVNLLSGSPSEGAIFSIGEVSPSAVSRGVFSRDLRRGDEGEEVRALQMFLNEHGFPVASAGEGSAGQETTHFGPLTEAALVRFQEAYAFDILAPLGLAKGTGFFGPSTRSAMQELFGS